jgi:hypothetical protein
VIHLKYERRFSFWALCLLSVFSPLVVHFPLPKVIKSRLTYQAFQVQGTGVTEERGDQRFRGWHIQEEGLGDGCLRECCRLREDPVAKVL